MKNDDEPPTVAEMRSLAEEADAEATAAEALAAAVRARARARRLRRDAEPVDTRHVEAVDDEAAAVDKAQRRRLGGKHRPRLSAAAAVLAVVVILFAVGASVEMSVLNRNAIRQREQVAEFADAARHGVVTLTSLDFEHAREGAQHILEISTGTFKDDFLRNVDDFTKSIEESKVISQGRVQAAAVEQDSMTENSMVVLVASTAEITNSAGLKQDSRKYRLVVTMTRDGGDLKMSQVEFVR